MVDDKEQAAAGGGSWSLLGFEYQVDVSVWLALDIMVAARMASELTLEHVSEEDVEADVEELEPGSVAETIPMRGYRLIVQAKRRTGNAWTEAKFLSLLKHGTRRKSAASRLADDPNARYVLVTSAALNDSVRDLGVRHVGSWPAASKIPQKIREETGDWVSGRIAVIGGQDDERLVNDIKTLLLERFRVPRANWENCLKALREIAWRLMRGHAGGRWTRDEAEQIIASHDGYLIGGTERDDYVEPTNWGDLVQALSTRHAVMIVGQSGSGKTATAEALWLERKAAIPDLKRIYITQGPDQLRIDQTLPPVLYDIEDPWGRFKFEPDRRPWNDRLAPAFQSARHDRLFIATSRSDVAHSSGALESVQRWQMPLDAENYGRAERRALYRKLSTGLPSELKSFAHQHEAAVLRQLSLPLELRKFFDGLPGVDREELAKNPAAAFSDAIEHAHRDSIERTVVEQIEARDAIKPIAILWALIKVYGHLSIDVLRSLDDRLADRDPSIEDKIDQLTSSFVAARNLRQGSDGSLTYYHGKVEAGIEAALTKHPQSVRRTLRLLIDALLARDDEASDNWGVETAAEILQISTRIPDATPQIALASHDRIDAWLEQRLVAEGKDLDTALKLAAVAGSKRSNLAEFARWIDHRPDPGFPGLMTWGRPERDNVWHARIGADPAVRTVAEAFVRTVLPIDQTIFPVQFASILEEIFGNLTDAFRDAALTSAEYGYIPNGAVIAEGALTDLAGFEIVVDAAVAAIQPTADELDRTTREWLRIVNDEVCEDYVEYFAADDENATAESYLNTYVSQVRVERGWQPLALHRHLVRLRSRWLGCLLRGDSPEPQRGEIHAAAKVSYGSDDEGLLWRVLTRYWDTSFAEQLMERMVVGSPEVSINRAALGCFVVRLAERMPDIIAQLSDNGPCNRLAQLALDLAHSATFDVHNAQLEGKRTMELIGKLPNAYQALANAEVAILRDEVPILSSSASDVLLGINNATGDVRLARLRLTQCSDRMVEDVRWVLLNANRPEEAVCAIEVAIRCGMAAEVERAFNHRFAHVAAKAISAFAAPLTAPLPSMILDQAKRQSSPVRKALLAQLVAKPHRDHLSTLMLLVGDEWQRWVQQENDDGNFPIARDAVEAITALDDVPDDALGEFTDRAKTTEDLVLMGLLLGCVVRHGDEQRQAQVVEMSRKGRRIVVGRAAAFALLDKQEYLKDANVALITRKMILNLPAMIASCHVLVIGLRGAFDVVNALADALVVSDDRRIFLALLARAVRERDVARAVAISARLPSRHPARMWAECEDVVIDPLNLIDLGDASAVMEAYSWMKSSTAKSV